MEDEAYAELDRQCQAQSISPPPRWEFDRIRKIIAQAADRTANTKGKPTGDIADLA